MQKVKRTRWFHTLACCAACGATGSQNADIGMAAAVGLYQSVVGFVLVFISNWLVKRLDPDRSLF